MTAPPSMVFPCRNVTLPPTEPPYCGATVAVNVTGNFTYAGAGDAESVVVVAALATETVNAARCAEVRVRVAEILRDIRVRAGGGDDGHTCRSKRKRNRRADRSSSVEEAYRSGEEPSGRSGHVRGEVQRLAFALTATLDPASLDQATAPPDARGADPTIPSASGRACRSVACWMPRAAVQPSSQVCFVICVRADGCSQIPLYQAQPFFG